MQVEDIKFPLIVKERQGADLLDEEYDYYRLSIGFFKDYPLPKAIPETQISGMAYELVRNRCPDCWHYDAEENFWDIEGSSLDLISLIKQEIIQTLIENDIDPIIGKDDKKKSLTPLSLTLEDAVIVATESDGFIDHQTGFFIKIKGNWIISELTYFRGKIFKKDKEGKEKVKSGVFPYLFYNKNGKRNYTHPDEPISLNGKSIIVEGRTFATQPLPTLMSFETSHDFLNGKTVEIKDVYPILKQKQAKFVNFDWDKRLYDLEACIAIATYFFDVFKAFPIVFFYGSSDTGKGRGLKSIIFASHKGMLFVSPTPATTFRTIDAFRPTLGIDEFTKIYEELMVIIRAIYKKGLKVPRTEEVKGEGRLGLGLFETYCSLVLASTRELEPVTMTRTIKIVMKRAPDPNPEKNDPEPYDFEDIRGKLYLCRLTQANKVHETMVELNKMKLGLEGREWEIWRPILTIAKMVGDDDKVFNNVLKLSQELYYAKYADLYKEEKDILTALHNIFTKGGKITRPAIIVFRPIDVKKALWKLKSSEYSSEEGFNKTHSPNKIGWTMKRMGLKKKLVYEGSQYTMTLNEFKDLCQRFNIRFEGI